MWKCKNAGCNKLFPIPAQIAIEEKPRDFTSNATRIIVTYAACPYCRSKEIEEELAEIEAEESLCEEGEQKPDEETYA